MNYWVNVARELFLLHNYALIIYCDNQEYSYRYAGVMSQYGYYTSSRAGLEGGTELGQQKRSWGGPVEQPGKRQRVEEDRGGGGYYSTPGPLQGGLLPELTVPVFQTVQTTPSAPQQGAGQLTGEEVQSGGVWGPWTGFTPHRVHPPVQDSSRSTFRPPSRPVSRLAPPGTASGPYAAAAGKPLQPRPAPVSAPLDSVEERGARLEQWAWGSGREGAVTVGTVRHKLHSEGGGGAGRLAALQGAGRVGGGLGERLLQKMGWRAGEGLGRAGEGTTEPILITEIKTDRVGLASTDDAKNEAFSSAVKQKEKYENSRSKFSEMKSTSFWSWHGAGMKGPENVKDRLKETRKAPRKKVPAEEVSEAKVDLEGKHPTSGLMEICTRRKWPQPRFSEERLATGGFRFRVEVNGVVYTPEQPSGNKKEAKKVCAQHCLVKLGLLPS